MKRHNYVEWLIVLGIGLCLSLLSLQEGIGTLRRIGPGTFPLILGLALTLIALVKLGAEVVAKEPSRRPSAGTQPVNWRATLFISLALLAWALLLTKFGWLISAMAMIGLASMAEKKPDFRAALLSYGIAVVLGYLVFVQLLAMPIKMI